MSDTLTVDILYDRLSVMEPRRALLKMYDHARQLERELAQARNDAEDDIARLHREKMKFFERVIELERALKNNAAQAAPNAAIARDKRDAALYEAAMNTPLMKALTKNAAQNAAGHSEGTQQQTHVADVPASQGNQAASRPDVPAAPASGPNTTRVEIIGHPGEAVSARCILSGCRDFSASGPSAEAERLLERIEKQALFAEDGRYWRDEINRVLRLRREHG